MELEVFHNKVVLIRDQKVMLDCDVALALDIETGKLNENAKTSAKWEYLRNEGIEEQYRFQLTDTEYDIMRSEIPTASKRNISASFWVYTRRGCAYFGTSMNNPKACDLAIQLADAFVDRQTDPVLASLAAATEVRKRQLRLEADLKLVQKLEEETRSNVKEIQTRLDNMNGDSGYATVLAYLRTHDISLPLSLCKQIGKEASIRCRDKDINIGRVPDERWGSVNSYPIAILDKIIEDFQ